MDLEERRIIKEFNNGYVIMGNGYNVVTPTNERDNIDRWCMENQVEATITVWNLSGCDVWIIKNEQKRNWFTLKWA